MVKLVKFILSIHFWRMIGSQVIILKCIDIFFKYVIVMKNCCRSEETKETRQLIGSNPGTEKRP